ncbi:hypothetical protein GUJ93_ZPchr0009g940 [Zizania palustris]|uniref:Uncharacterized protein n=1 Tax=Zizania palustris TaxID=103762 RepID=A0A8J5V2Q9_ZIZPA|nr:hypothetical protein GUJ93_ZPchr0009g940 [Zizania palustris]
MIGSAAARRGGNGGAAAGGGGWLHAAWLALTGATPASLLTEEVAGGGFSLPALTARSSSPYEPVSTEESDGDDASWGSSETEQFLLTREGDPKTTTTTTTSPERIITRDELRMGKPVFWLWSAKKNTGEPESMAVEESEAFLPRRRGAPKRINNADTEDHPLSFDRHGRESSSSSSSSSLLLSSS